MIDLSTELKLVYSSKKVTPFGGMTLLKDFIDKVGFIDFFDDVDLPEPKSNRGYYPKQIILGFWLSIWTGASRFLHADWLRYDEVLMKIFGLKQLPSQSTYSRFFHKFSFFKNEQIFSNIQRQFFELTDCDSLTVDIDSTVITRYGEQEGANKGYNPRKPGRSSHHPLMAFVPQFNMVANAWMRPGNTADLSSYEPFLRETIEDVLSGQTVGLIRADSGFYSEGLLSYLESKSLNYITAVKFYPTIKREVVSISDWCRISTGIDYVTFHYASEGGKRRRYTVVRKNTRLKPKASGKTIDLFGDDSFHDYRYSCFVSNLNLPGDEIWASYRRRADCENRIKELKADFGMENFCLSDFWATEAAFRFMMMAYNIISLFRHFGLQSPKAHTLQTIRSYCFALGAWTSTHAKQTVLKVSLPTKKRSWMDGIFENIRGLDPPYRISNA